VLCPIFVFEWPCTNEAREGPGSSGFGKRSVSASASMVRIRHSGAPQISGLHRCAERRGGYLATLNVLQHGEAERMPLAHQLSPALPTPRAFMTYFRAKMARCVLLTLERR
jgi:hypothetical protein